MSRLRRLTALALLLLLLPPGPRPLLGQTPPATDPSAVPPEGVWPRELVANGANVLVYQPQVDKWDGNRLEARAAVAVRAPGAAQPSFGVVWITARTEVDKERGLVYLQDIKIPKVNFPESPERNA